MLKPCINTKLQNRHAQVNLLYQWIRYKTYANTEGKLMARLTDFHRQQPSSSSSSSEYGKISGLDWSASSRESGITLSTSSSDESNDSGSGGYVEIMLSDIDAKKCAADLEEGKIGEESDAAGAAESEESLIGVKVDLQNLVKQKLALWVSN
jgi:hypothetical protein